MTGYQFSMYAPLFSVNWRISCWALFSNNSRRDRTCRIQNFTGGAKNQYGPFLGHFLSFLNLIIYFYKFLFRLCIQISLKTIYKGSKAKKRPRSLKFCPLLFQIEWPHTFVRLGETEFALQHIFCLSISQECVNSHNLVPK